MISVVIPLYNKEPIIEKTLKSVLSQDYSDFEVVVVDDGSTDNSVALVESIGDPRIRLIKQENGGPSKARNTGVKNAKGNWILFIDADDEMLPETLNYFSSLISKVADAKIFLGEVLFNKDGVISKANQYNEGYVNNPFKAHLFDCLTECTGSLIYKKELCLEYPFDENIRRYEDLKPLFDLYRKYKVYLCPKPVVQINLGYSSASKARTDIQEDFLAYIDFKGKSFWECMCLFAFFLGERNYYSEQCRRIYSSLYHRYDLLLIYKLISLLKKKPFLRKKIGFS